VKIHSNFSPDCHRSPGPLFEFRWVTVVPVTKAGLHVRHRFGVRPELADLIAFHAGLGSAADR
jgi:hypothetical protein